MSGYKGKPPVRFDASGLEESSRFIGALRRFSTAQRRGITLLELLAVVAILGLFAVVAVSRIGPGTLHNFGARSDARRLVLDLLQARRRSIATGENHYLAFTVSGGRATDYTLYRRSATAGNVAVDATHTFPGDVVVSTSHDDAEFTFEGTALAAYQITLTGPSQTWQVDVVPVTGTVGLTQTAP